MGSSAWTHPIDDPNGEPLPIQPASTTQRFRNRRVILGVTSQDGVHGMDPPDRRLKMTSLGRFALNVFSDDELEPYDMSNDRVVEAAPRPRYVRDCMEGLLDSGNPQRVEVCLTAAAGLVRAHTTTVQEVRDVMLVGSRVGQLFHANDGAMNFCSLTARERFDFKFHTSSSAWP